MCRAIFFALITVFFLMTNHLGADAANIRWFNTLMKATEFADAEIGEAPFPSQFWLAYREALVEPEKISDDDLHELHKNATPAGKLYAACLMNYARTARRSGDADADLKSLLTDSSKVFYRSGCRGTNTTVGEVSSSLLKERKFLNFRIDDLSKIKSAKDVSDSILILSSACRLENSLVGEGSVSSTHAQYKRARTLPLNARGWEINWLCAHGTPAGKLYGCFLALKIDAEAGIDRFRQLEKDESKVQYQSGCEVETFSVGAIAKQVVEKRKFADFEI